MKYYGSLNWNMTWSRERGEDFPEEVMLMLIAPTQLGTNTGKKWGETFHSERTIQYKGLGREHDNLKR